MSKSILFLLLSFSFNSFAQNIDDFAWLEGSWQMQMPQKDASQTVEKWWNDGKKLQSTSTVLDAETATITETMAMENDGADWYFIAHPSENEAPVKFKLTDWGENFFIAENPEHDFPKKIRYQRTRDILVAEISADEQKVLFTFEKMGEE